MQNKTFKSFTEMAEALGHKRRKPQKEWLESEMKKISKCPRCGAQLVYTGGTNVMTCVNQIEVTREITHEDGTVQKQKQMVDCGFIKFLTPSTSSYAQFLYDSMKEAS